MADQSQNIYINVIGKDEASNALQGVAGSLQRIGEFAIGGLLARGVEAIGGALMDMASGALGAENVMADLDATLQSTGAAAMNAVADMARATPEAAGAMKDAADAHGEAIKSVMDSAREAAENLNTRLSDLADANRERQAELRGQLADLDSEFTSAQRDRQERLQDTLEGIHERAADRRTSLQDRLAQTTDATKRAQLQKELAQVSTQESKDATRARQRAQREEARARQQHEKREQQLNAAIVKENAQYEKQTAKIKLELDKVGQARDEQLAKAEAAYTKSLNKIKDKFTAVELGLALPKKVEQISREAILDLASSFQEVTPFEDEMIIKGQSMLLTFTNIGKNVFPEATEAMLNMGQKFGSVDAAAIQLGKALNNPIEGVTALRRVGVMLSDAQEQQIKKFMAVGDIENAQKIILKELQTEFGGVARAAGNTLGGQLAILRNRFGDTLEMVGGAFLPTLKEMTKWINANMLPVFKKLAEDYAPRLQSAVQSVADVFGSLMNGLNGGGWSDFAGALSKFLPADLSETAATIIARLVDALKTGDLSAMLDWLKMVGDKIATWASSQDGQAYLTETANKIGASLANALVEFVRVSQEVGKFLFELVTRLADWVNNDGKEPLRNLAFAFANGFKDAFGEAASQINWGELIWGAVQRGFEFSLPGMMYNISNRIGTELGNTIGGVVFPGRALGGPVLAHQPYLVGERGPELFVPRTSGAIVPHDAMRAASSSADNRRMENHFYITSNDPNQVARMIDQRLEQLRWA